VYIAFIKNHVTINGDRQQCDVNVFGEPDCMSELESQILILMLVRLVLGNAKELLVPFLKGAFRLLRAKCLVCPILPRARARVFARTRALTNPAEGQPLPARLPQLD
ncbi:hypothetical protein EON62_00845, partial [archaeon]